MITSQARIDRRSPPAPPITRAGARTPQCTDSLWMTADASALKQARKYERGVAIADEARKERFGISFLQALLAGSGRWGILLKF